LIGARPEFHKPSGDFLRHFSRQANIQPTGILFVGDSDLDYLAAKDAGALYYHARWTGEPVSVAWKHASGVLDRLSDVVSIIESASSGTNDSSVIEWREAVEQNRFSFYGGAGISVGSGVGTWEDHYRPVLSRLSAGHLARDMELTEALQLLAANPLRAKRVFDAFRDSFALKNSSPNSFHYAMLRSGAERVWTSNYDTLFERANTVAHFGRAIARSDADVLDSPANHGSIIKMNGDFESAHFREDLEWGVVFLQEQFDRGERSRPEIWRLFEDDYRNRSIIFVGVSFRDPVLRRIIAIARQKIAKTRYNHYLLVKRDPDPATRLKQQMFADNLQRSSIVTIFKDSYQEILEFVQEVALTAYRPIIGFSGSVGRLPDSATEEELRLSVPEGMALAAGEIDRICRTLGAQLARRGYRVTSGCSLFVGMPPVEAAFTVDPSLARFYLREQGGSRYRRSAPAVIVKGREAGATKYAAMRLQFVSELSALVALGGRSSSGQQSGTIQEVEMALDREIPVVLLKCVGGDVSNQYGRLRQRMNSAYKDDKLRDVISDANDKVDRVPAGALHDFARDRLPDLLTGIMLTAMGSISSDIRPSDARWWGPQSGIR
jgi:hypothetical protein